MKGKVWAAGHSEVKGQPQQGQPCEAAALWSTAASLELQAAASASARAACADATSLTAPA